MTTTTKNNSSSSKRRQKKSSGNRLALWLMTIGIAAVIMAGCAALFCLSRHSGESRWVYVPEGASNGALRDSLCSTLGSAQGARIYSLWRLANGNIKRAHGAYRVDGGETALRTARRIKRGTQTPVKVSFIGSRTLNDVARRFTAKLECTPEEFIDACERQLPEAGFKPAEFPAAFLPDTYEVYWTDSGDRLVERLLKHRNKFWNDERRAKASAIGLTPVKVATLASIVEEETAKTTERPTVARLYLNRLQQGMKLQADPTVKFATGNPQLRRITGQHLKIESPYNTYIHAGLPPGPIRVVEAATLDAVLNAPKHSYIYMCAREDFSGFHNFASDFATHSDNARRYQQELNRRGIK